VELIDRKDSEQIKEGKEPEGVISAEGVIEERVSQRVNSHGGCGG
jgi:hypothetical protein